MWPKGDILVASSEMTFDDDAQANMCADYVKTALARAPEVDECMSRGRAE